ncbi:hypothetical protein NMY22_g12900 [Coprinellus aureogranulatus]|nr:hypothetical protein NMY22_g12900 [Coprinellus aureogranulatus]
MPLSLTTPYDGSMRLGALFEISFKISPSACEYTAGSRNHANSAREVHEVIMPSMCKACMDSVNQRCSMCVEAKDRVFIMQALRSPSRLCFEESGVGEGNARSIPP